MTMSIARLSAQSGLRYLFKTTMMDDVSPAPRDATSYYMKAGTPQGRWLGGGLGGVSRARGDPVTETDANAIFDETVHPDTGAPLGRPHGQPTLVQNRQGQAGTRRAVAGFDLTFSVPKSVSVLWALSPRTLQDQILQTHHDAVNAALGWLEELVIHTRAGRNGVAHVGTRGAIAAAFDHWESRAGDPQLHTHLVIANRVQRVTDGAWVALDSRTLYKAAVAASEHYNGLLFDALHRDLGTDTGIREPATTAHNPSAQLTGVDDSLIREFSNRSRLIEVETDRLVAEWTKDHGTPPSATTTIKLRQQATLSTRTPKPDTITPLHELSARWQARAAAKGFEPRLVLANTIRRSRTNPFRSSDFTADWIDAVATLTRERVAAKRATWNRWNLLAEAERVCAAIRCHTPADRNALIDALATAAEAQSVHLNEYRYSVPADAQSGSASRQAERLRLPRVPPLHRCHDPRLRGGRHGGKERRRRPGRPRDRRHGGTHRLPAPRQIRAARRPEGRRCRDPAKRKPARRRRRTRRNRQDHHPRRNQGSLGSRVRSRQRRRIGARGGERRGPRTGTVNGRGECLQVAVRVRPWGGQSPG
ncbi:hypothetical protein GCM10023346_43600 [Arthrobacter gyeryongensis]|uniref:TrwC relaxase domain-containing protein n=1 Tax=Arthrobacter gyeryongensis TaxID=1650592 RepID=A0ABP9SQE9_9MICC